MCSLQGLAVQAAMSRSKHSALLQEIADECAANRDSIPPEPATRAFLFEGQLSQNETVRHCPHRLENLQH